MGWEPEKARLEEASEELVQAAALIRHSYRNQCTNRLFNETIQTYRVQMEGS
jgi:hypothetical protein